MTQPYKEKSTMQFLKILCTRIVYVLFTSRFLIAIGVKTIIIWHVLNNKYDQLISFLRYNYFSSYLHDKHCIFASILLITYKMNFIEH